MTKAKFKVGDRVVRCKNFVANEDWLSHDEIYAMSPGNVCVISYIDTAMGFSDVFLKFEHEQDGNYCCFLQDNYELA